MSPQQTVSQYVHARMQEAFGPPHTTVGRDFHWMFRSSSDALPMNILLNGTLETAVVWIFDANDAEDGVHSMEVLHENDADVVIKRIEARMKPAAAASAPVPHPGGTE